MNLSRLRHILDQLDRHDISVVEAQAALDRPASRPAVRGSGFCAASITTGRCVQVFPEVIFGQGKTPAQLAAIADRIASHGQTLLITRTTETAFETVREKVPDATWHADARIISRRQDDVPAGHGTILVVAAGTSDLSVAEEAAVSAEVMNNTVDRLYDVGVAGLHRLLSEQPRA